MTAFQSLARNPLTWLAFVLIAVLLVYLNGELAKQVRPATPKLPELLRGLTAGGGVGMSCETTDIALAAHSPDLINRLKQRFPLGSRAESLENYLESLGFTITSPCPDDGSIHMALFRQERGGGLSYPATATIWWKDSSGALKWITANIFYSGL